MSDSASPDSAEPQASANSERMPQTGDMIGPFRLENQLGEGGMGIVYRAIDTSLDRMVAIKFFNSKTLWDKPKLVIEELKRRFIREARLSAKVNHPNLAQIFHAGLDAATPYFVMEYLEGETLEDLLEREPQQPMWRICYYALQVGTALRYAWESNQIVHRDLKPANIMILGGEQIKLLDLGIAKVAEGGGMSKASITRPGIGVGSPLYMAPEQHVGEPDVDHRGDIFAFGAILYRMLTQKQPFEGDSEFLLYSAKMEGVKDLETYAPDCPMEFAQLVYSMLDPNRDTRISSHAEIIRILNEVHAEVAEDGSPGLPASSTFVGAKPAAKRDISAEPVSTNTSKIKRHKTPPTLTEMKTDGSDETVMQSMDDTISGDVRAEGGDGGKPKLKLRRRTAKTSSEDKKKSDSGTNLPTLDELHKLETLDVVRPAVRATLRTSKQKGRTQAPKLPPPTTTSARGDKKPAKLPPPTRHGTAGPSDDEDNDQSPPTQRVPRLINRKPGDSVPKALTETGTVKRSDIDVTADVPRVRPGTGGTGAQQRIGPRGPKLMPGQATPKRVTLPPPTRRGKGKEEEDAPGSAPPKFDTEDTGTASTPKHKLKMDEDEANTQTKLKRKKVSKDDVFLPQMKELLDTIQPGMVLGDYEALDLIGYGGMGAVYRGLDLNTNEQVALKFLIADEMDDFNFRIHQIRNEAKIISRLDHPSIVKLHDMQQKNGLTFLVMDLFLGPNGAPVNLVDYVANFGDASGLLAEDDCKQIMISLLGAIGYAHSMGVVHCDLKPENVLFDCVNIHPDGRWDAFLMLTDFGLAKIVGEEMVLSSATASVDSFAGGADSVPKDADALIGTFEYMSPEQRRGEPATPASDLFTVGIMMLRLLTGAKELGLRSRPSKLRPDLHRGWDKVILKAIRENPTERFPHAISMAMAINELDLTT